MGAGPRPEPPWATGSSGPGWSRPLLSPAAISRRLGAVEALVNAAIPRQELSAALREVPDLERLIGRIVYGTAGGRDLVSLSAGLGKLPRLREHPLPPARSPAEDPGGGDG